MKTCFVAQPFDRDKFDRRYTDIFEPAIKNAGLEPYRVDRDPNVRIPIEDIEGGIKASEIVFVDITLDNPNVWYELGYAFACQKDVVMVCCSDERTGKFPFDIQHRYVITYRTSAPSDFLQLGEAITGKIKAFLSASKTIESIAETPINKLQGLEGFEIAMLLILMERQTTPGDDVSIYLLKQDMDKAGYNPIATSVGLRTLTTKGMLATFSQFDPESGEEYTASRITEKGEQWVLQNLHLITFKKELPF